MADVDWKSLQDQCLAEHNLDKVSISKLNTGVSRRVFRKAVEDQVRVTEVRQAIQKVYRVGMTEEQVRSAAIAILLPWILRILSAFLPSFESMILDWFLKRLFRGDGNA